MLELISTSFQLDLEKMIRIQPFLANSISTSQVKPPPCLGWMPAIILYHPRLLPALLSCLFPLKSLLNLSQITSFFWPKTCVFSFHASTRSFQLLSLTISQASTIITLSSSPISLLALLMDLLCFYLRTFAPAAVSVLDTFSPGSHMATPPLWSHL